MRLLPCNACVRLRTAPSISYRLSRTKPKPCRHPYLGLCAAYHIGFRAVALYCTICTPLFAYTKPRSSPIGFRTRSKRPRVGMLDIARLAWSAAEQGLPADHLLQLPRCRRFQTPAQNLWAAPVLSQQRQRNFLNATRMRVTSFFPKSKSTNPRRRKRGASETNAPHGYCRSYALDTI